VLPDGRTPFNLIQNATDTSEGALIFFIFDLLFLNGKDITGLPLVERKARLAALLKTPPAGLRYHNHQIGHGPLFHRLACEHGLEGIVSKRTNAPYEPDRRTWLKIKCLNREDFIVVGWSDPEGSRHRIGALLLGYYTPDGELIHAGRAGTGISERELERLWQRLQPLVVPKIPLSVPPPRGGRFGSPLVLSRVHWVRPEIVVEVSYVEWTPDGLLRHVVYLGEREDKPAIDVRRDRPDQSP
jgi:bifunctional non-homologous end joining protein LigD